MKYFYALLSVVFLFVTIWVIFHVKDWYRTPLCAVGGFLIGHFFWKATWYNNKK